MRKQQKTGHHAPVVISADDGTVLATCTFVPHAGKVPVDRIAADMVMISRSHGGDIPEALHLHGRDAAGLIKRALAEEFVGECGESRILHLPESGTDQQSLRQVVLVGLGPSHAFCDSIVCKAFAAFINHAIDAGVTAAVVPFVVNPHEKFCLTHKATAYRLKSMLKRVARSRGGLGKLKEIKIYCTPAAVRSIREGLTISATACDCGHDNCCR